MVLRYGKGNLEIVKKALTGHQKKSPTKTFINGKDRKGKRYINVSLTRKPCFFLYSLPNMQLFLCQYVDQI